MKFLTLCLTVLTAAALCGASVSDFVTSPKSPRRINFGKTPRYTLIKNGKVCFSVSAKYSSRDKGFAKAVKELCAALSQISGKKITASAKPVPGTFVIQLGYSPEKLDRDGFTITTSPGKVAILGSKSGTGILFGVYDFLERFAGVRFFFPGKYGTIIPAKKSWQIPDINIIDRPDYQHRQVYWEPWVKDSKLYPWYVDGNARERYHVLLRHHKRLRMSNLELPNCHGLRHLNLVGRFAKTHPEYFALNPDGKRMDGSTGLTYEPNKDGQICFSAQGLKEEIYKDCVALLTGKPASSRNIVQKNGKSYWMWTQRFPFFNIMSNDGLMLCRCKDCWKAYSQLPEFGGNDPQPATELIWKWHCDIAAKLKKNNIPGYVTTMAYHVYRPVPKNISIPDNLIMMLALRGPWSDPLPATRKSEEQLIYDWYKKMGSKIYLWTYPTKCTTGLPGIPNTSPRNIGAYYPRYSPYIFGAFMEAESDCWLFGYLNYYVFGKVMWNNKADVDAILKDHCKVMFGGAADTMLEFFDLMEKLWTGKCSGNVINTWVGPKCETPNEFELWNKIFTPQVIKRVNDLFAKARRGAGKREYLERVNYICKYFWGPVLELRNEYTLRTEGKEEWSCVLPEIKTPGSITIDGKADEAVWKKLAPVYLLPIKNAAALRTTVKMFRDRKNYYFFFDCEDPDTALISAPRRAHDTFDIWKDDEVELHLDFHGKRAGKYQLLINASGSVADKFYNDKIKKSDWKWSSGATVKTRVIPNRGWTMELAVPRSRFPEPANGFLYADFNRFRPGKKGKIAPDLYHWSHFAKNFGDISGFGKVWLKPVKDNNILADENFTAVPDPAETSKKWYSWAHKLQVDRNIFRTGGAAIRMDSKHFHLAQKLPDLKPDKEYIFSFFVKLENIFPHGKKGYFDGFMCRFDDGAPLTNRGRVWYRPAKSLKGTMDWQFMRFKFRTSNETGKRCTPIMYFCVPKAGNGKAWVDKVRIEEVK